MGIILILFTKKISNVGVPPILRWLAPHFASARNDEKYETFMVSGGGVYTKGDLGCLCDLLVKYVWPVMSYYCILW